MYLDKIAVPGEVSSVVACNMTRSLGRCYKKFLARCTSQWGEVESVATPEGLPWTDSVHSCILYQLATLDNKDIICYKEKTLAKYSLPSVWLAGLGGDGSI